MENLWKSFNNILWTTDDSAIGKINICGDPDSTIGRKKPQKKNPGAKRLDKFTVNCSGPWYVLINFLFSKDLEETTDNVLIVSPQCH